MERSGHKHRLDDLDRIAALGIRTLRYPFLWEHHTSSWSWADARARRMQELGIAPIAGLLHHGSGPPFTSLVDPRFPALFAEYAAAFAARFPWIQDYTPINEPLTTARFSGLYGLWYPHGKNDVTFLRALLNECKATVLAMQVIRRVQPRARLVQTEDWGHITCSRGLEYQRDHQNALRWLSFDLLMGRVTSSHALFEYLTRNGVTAPELAWFVAHAAPPDIIGVNHYATSDRHLDLDLAAHAPEFHGGNDTDRYADVHTSMLAPLRGHHAMLLDVWRRYQRPVAITEVHLGDNREEQLRWVRDVWSDAERARAEGADVRAITLWAAFGSFDWNSLVTVDRGFYEPGLFDVRSPKPRKTALGRMASALVKQEPFHHPVLESPGWWRYGSSARAARLAGPVRYARPLLVTGGRGTLGVAIARACERRGLHAHLVGRADLDIAARDDVARVVRDVKPWAIINAAGWVRVDEAERQREACFRANSEGAGVLAEECAATGTRFITFSTDLVFDGARRTPYTEGHPAAPLNVYGQSKLRAEEHVQRVLPNGLIVRTSAFFGPWDESNFVTHVLRALVRGGRVRVPSALTVSPTYVPALVDACLDLLVDDEGGLFHLANRAEVTWLDLARMAARMAKFSEGLVDRSIRPCAPCDIGWHAPRPLYSALGSTHRLMPDLEESLRDYLREGEPTWGRK